VSSVNCYEDTNRARAYATLEFANTYHLAFRDLPEILSAHVTGLRALDFGCGTGRSTRVLRRLGFDVTGVDISEDMLRLARTTDPPGDYRLVPGDDLSQFASSSCDLVLCAFPFDNIHRRNEGKSLSRPSKTAGAHWSHRQCGFVTRDLQT
jgi:ubiquinone/menaquinone biosynthesis C-methylase UbiE